ncbi:MAG: uroporphyrinogen decarboxylase family protein [Spirochaetota bacterium]
MKIPLSLSVYEHAAKLIGAAPWDASRDPELLFKAHAKAYELYRHMPVVVGIDIYNLEAEAYGCIIDNPGGTGIPAITAPLFASLEDALGLTPISGNEGRIPSFITVAERLKKLFPEADIRMPVSGPFSIAVNLIGMETLMMAAVIEPERTRRFLDVIVDGQLAFVRAVHDRGVGIAFFESAAAPPLLSPDTFKEVELPALKRVIGGTRDIIGRAVPCIIGGNTAPIIPHMLATGTNFLICPAETDRNIFLSAMEDHPEVNVRVNLNPALYTSGTKGDIAREVDAVTVLARGRKNILLGTGGIPYETPMENILFLKEYAAA